MKKILIFITLLILIYYAIRFCIFNIDFYNDTRFFFYAGDINEFFSKISLGHIYESFTLKWKYSFFAGYVKYSQVMILVISLIGAGFWLVQSKRWKKTITLVHIYLIGLLLYGTFVIMDQFNSKFQEQGGNFAFRVYEFFGYVAAILCIIGFVAIVHYLRNPKMKVMAKYGFAILICIFCILAPFKATVDPWVSHQAQYFENTELIAIENLKNPLHAETDSISPGPEFNEIHFPLIYKLVYSDDVKNIVWEKEHPTIILNTQYVLSLAEQDPAIQLTDTRMSDQIYGDGFNTMFFNISERNLLTLNS